MKNGHQNRRKRFLREFCSSCSEVPLLLGPLHFLNNRTFDKSGLPLCIISSPQCPFFFFLRIYFFLNISSTHLSKLYMETFSPLSLMLHVVLIFGLHNLLLEQGRKTIHKAKIKKKKDKIK